MARISRRYPSPAQLLKDGEILSQAVEANSEEIPNLAAHQVKLQARLREIRELTVRAGVLQAEKQEVNRQRREAMEGAAKLMSLLNVGLKEHYGSGAEKLVAFGVKPFRGLRKRGSPDSAPVSPAENPASTDSDSQ